MGALTELFVAEAHTDVLSLSLSLSLRKCVDCHLSHGLTQKEAGHCNHTCSPLVGYMDDVSGTASLAVLWISGKLIFHKGTMMVLVVFNSMPGLHLSSSCQKDSAFN